MARKKAVELHIGNGMALNDAPSSTPL